MSSFPRCIRKAAEALVIMHSTVAYRAKTSRTRILGSIDNCAHNLSTILPEWTVLEVRSKPACYSSTKIITSVNSRHTHTRQAWLIAFTGQSQSCLQISYSACDFWNIRVRIPFARDSAGVLRGGLAKLVHASICMAIDIKRHLKREGRKGNLYTLRRFRFLCEQGTY